MANKLPAKIRFKNKKGKEYTLKLKKPYQVKSRRRVA